MSLFFYFAGIVAVLLLAVIGLARFLSAFSLRPYVSFPIALACVGGLAYGGFQIANSDDCSGEEIDISNENLSLQLEFALPASAKYGHSILEGRLPDKPAVFGSFEIAPSDIETVVKSATWSKPVNCPPGSVPDLNPRLSNNAHWYRPTDVTSGIFVPEAVAAEHDQYVTTKAMFIDTSDPSRPKVYYQKRTKAK